MASDAATRSPLHAVLPDYEVLGELGRGAMGVVLAARHRSLDRDVAIKELPPAFASDDTVRQRFLREARTLASLNHPHVVQVYDFVDRGGRLALIMERLPGGTVWQRFTSDGFSAPTACGLILAAAAGLDHAHGHGVLHRDIKPENLMFTEQGSLKVTDFGIAKVMGGERTLATLEGAILGTPAYMAPEQAEGLAVGPAADVYACGTMLFELLSGQLPFARAATPMATLIARIRDEAPSLGGLAPHVPAPIAAVVDRALAREAGDRYDSVEDMAVALGQAAAAAWGPNWLAATGLTVNGSDAISWAIRTPQAGGGGGGTMGFTRASSIRRGPAPDTVVDLRDDRAGRDLSGIRPTQLVDVAELARPRRLPLGRMAAALVAAALVAAMAVVAAGGGPPLHAPAIDFSQAFPVSGLGEGSEVNWQVSALGVPLGQVTAPLSAGSAVIEPGYLRWTAGGTLDVTTVVDGESRPPTDRQVVAAQPWATTGPNVAVTMLALFGLASALSHHKGLRRSRSRLPVGPLMGLAVAGAVLGLTAAGYGWLVMGTPLVVPSLAICAVFGAGAGVSAGWASRSRRRPAPGRRSGRV